MKSHRLYLSLFQLIVFFAASGCATLQYRAVQNQFENAVRADNERFAIPFTEPSSGYQAVADQLTADYINALDPKLRPNAWTLRSVSQWRAGELAEAVGSSLEGLAEIDRLKPQATQLENGRDSIILTMVPGLVEDARVRERFRERGTANIVEDYREYSDRFRSAIRALAEARKKVAAPTPPEVVQYWNFQVWRVLANWLSTISKLPRDARIEANSEADSFIRTAFPNAALADVSDIVKAMNSAIAAIPDGHPYRMLIELERER